MNSGPLPVISFVSLVSPSTEERLHDGGDSACGLWFVWFWVVLVVLVLFSTIRLFFPSFNDDLGTMPTRRPYSWKKKGSPWVTSWARATFEQGILSVLPMLTGPCTVTSLPGEHLFQASALPRNRMRPAIFHAFGNAKVGAQAALRELELQGWETLPIAILGMPNLPPAWVIETWKPVGGCKFTGYFSGVAGNSALCFCLLLKWRAIRPQATELFPAQLQGDSLSCLPAEDGDADVESVSTPSSDTSARRADRLTKAIERDSTQGS